MKLINKAIIVIGLTTIVFLACISLKVIRYPLYNIAILTILFSLTLLWLWRMIAIKRVEHLNHDLAEVVKDNATSYPIDVTGNDEISTITVNINQLIDKFKSSNEKFERRIIHQTQELNDKNAILQQEMSKRVLAERREISNRECLTQIAKYDELTSLPNRVFFNELLNKSINHSKRRKNILAILVIDLDAFSKVKDMLGAANSNLVLKEIGKRFLNVLRSEDIVAKLEGDEFIVLLNDIGKPKFAGMVAEKLLNICSQLIKVDTHEFSLSASIGICIYPNDGLSLEDLLENAEKALFKVKQTGGGTYQFHSQEIHTEAREYLQLDSALRKAIHNNELALYYQPKFRIKQGDITGVEALMRWEHPVLGIVSPSKFIPLSEDSGLIMQLGEWALREACQTMKYWHDEGYEHMTVAMKLSSRQFHHPDMSKIITKVLKGSGLNPKYLELEITEQTVMDNVESALKILEEIKTTGVQISIDHFGTGYTSIRYLKLFPLSAIKIDQSFIKGIPHNPNDSAITNAVIGLSHHLGFEVVAEGVETAEQVQYLANHNCDIVQGYFLSYPLPVAKVVLQFKKLSEGALA